MQIQPWNFDELRIYVFRETSEFHIDRNSILHNLIV
jgi:hypothetical protein